MNLDFKGLDELISEVERLDKVSTTVKNRALVRGGDILLENMKNEVYANGLTRRSGEAVESLIRTDPRNGELYVGTQGGVQQPGFYLYMHEYGYYNVRAGRFISPKPFASIAWKKSLSAIMDAYVEEIRKAYGMV